MVSLSSLVTGFPRTAKLLAWLPGWFTHSGLVSISTRYLAYDLGSDLVTSPVTRLAACLTCLVTSLFMRTRPNGFTGRVTRLALVVFCSARHVSYSVGNMPLGPRSHSCRARAPTNTRALRSNSIPLITRGRENPQFP